MTNKYTLPWTQAQLNKTSTSVWYWSKCCPKYWESSLKTGIAANFHFLSYYDDIWLLNIQVALLHARHNADPFSKFTFLKGKYKVGWMLHIRNTKSQIHKYANTQICKYTNTPTFFFRSTTWHNWRSQMFGTTQCSWPCLLTNRCLGCRMPENTLQ